MAEIVKGSLSVGEQTFDTEDGLVPIADLFFYEENPRIYSLLQSSDLTQKQIEKKLCSFDYVKQLAQSIETVGLIDPIIVRKRDMAVLEGNSRLAAYRMLARKDANKYASIKARVLSGDISDKDIDILLGQYHIVGRKDWDPYEQAAFMSRQIKRGTSVQELAKSYGLSTQAVNRYIRNYDFMLANHETDPSTWSHWDEYLKSSNVKKLREDEEIREELDTIVINLVRQGVIKTANQDMRKVNDVCGTASNPRRKKIFQRFLDGDLSFADACSQVEAGADATFVLKKCEAFRKFIASGDTREQVDEMSDQDRKTLDYEVKKICTAFKTMGYSVEMKK